MEVTIYVCPTPGCGNYYGSSVASRLEDFPVGLRDINFEPKPEEQHRTRATCPDCFKKGTRVERIPHTVTLVPQGVDAPAAA